MGEAVCGVFSTLTENSGAEYDADAGIARAVHSAYAKEIADRLAGCATAKRLIVNVDRIRGGGVVAAAEPEAAQYTCDDNGDIQVTALGRPVQRVRDRLGTRRGKGCSGCVVM